MEGLTQHDIKSFLELLIMANDLQLAHLMIMVCREVEKREKNKEYIREMRNRGNEV